MNKISQLHKRFFALLGLLVCLCFGTVKAGSVQNPQLMLKDTVVKLQQQVRADHVSLQASPAKLYKIVQTVILPIVDVNRMAGLTLGPRWRQATSDQRKQFVDQFGLLVTRTYAKAILTVVDYEIKVHPPRQADWQDKKYLAIRGVILPVDGGKPVHVTYYLVRKGADWKVYDFAVEGVSFVKNFRSQFQSFANMKTLLDKLTIMNKQAFAQR